MERIREKTERIAREVRRDAQRSVTSREEEEKKKEILKRKRSRGRSRTRILERVMNGNDMYGQEEQLYGLTEKAAQEGAQAAQEAARRAQQKSTEAKETAKMTARAAKGTAAAVSRTAAWIREAAAALGDSWWIGAAVLSAVLLVTILAAAGVRVPEEAYAGIGEAVLQIDTEYAARIREEKETHPYDRLDLREERMDWQTVLALFFAQEERDAFAVWDETAAARLREMFWKIHSVSAQTETSDGMTVLHLTVLAKSGQEMTEELSFTQTQKETFEALKNSSALWDALTGGAGQQAEGLIAVARTQIGNRGGEPYWSWYGFAHRVPWCACFVSWCADRAGLLPSGALPKFSSCSAGVRWFRDRGRWYGADTVPAPGMIVFFDWYGDGSPDHTGIVCTVTADGIRTIEGNSGDACRERNYAFRDPQILGYGAPLF